MKKIDKTKAELFRELEETKKLVQELNNCQAEFDKAREKYEKLLDSTPDAMLFVNTQNKVVLVNAQFERRLIEKFLIVGRKVTGCAQIKSSFRVVAQILLYQTDLLQDFTIIRVLMRERFE